MICESRTHSIGEEVIKKETDKFIAKRMVVKIGTSTITREKKLDTLYMKNVAGQISTLINAGVDVVLVSSGAVACGREIDNEIEEGVAGNREAALFGQPVLMAEWSKTFADNDIIVGQTLLTEESLNKGCTLLQKAVARKKKNAFVLIVNANDAVNNYEIEQNAISADNDKLASHVARKIEADVLLFLTDVEGVIDNNDRIISCFQTGEEITIFEKSEAGKHGMASKIQVADEFDGISIITNGRTEDIILKIARGERIGTWFKRKHDKESVI